MNWIELKQKWEKLTRREMFYLGLLFGTGMGMMVVMVAVELFGLPP